MINAFIASICIALLSLVGVVVFAKKGVLRGAHRFLLPIAVGVFLGVVFFELMPETFAMSPTRGGVAIAIGFLFFYALSHTLETYHHHDSKHTEERVSSSAMMILVGDAIHNFSDGIVITSSFIISPAIGIATTLGVALHEVPQEVAEFGILLHAGYSKTRAALLNLLSASSVILGVLLTALFASFVANGLWILTGIAAGNLLYIAATDLLPELQESHRTHYAQSFLLTALSIVAVALLFSIMHE